MARTWHELFETGADAPEAGGADAPEPERRGFFKRLRDNMAKTRQAIGAELQTTIFQSLDDEAFERLEETLIYADVGAPTTAKIVERLETEAQNGDLQGGEDLSRRLRELLAETAMREGMEDLLDRLLTRPSAVEDLLARDSSGSGAGPVPVKGRAEASWRDQVREALIGLGWSVREAESAVESVEPIAVGGDGEPSDVPVPQLLRAARVAYWAGRPGTNPTC